MNNENLKTLWESASEAYLKAFCDKHEFDYADSFWIGDDPGTIACIGDYFVDMDDIRYDIDNDVPEESFFKWYDYSLDVHEIEVELNYLRGTTQMRHINYASFCKGVPLPYTDEQLDRLREMMRVMEDLGLCASGTLQ